MYPKLVVGVDGSFWMTDYHSVQHMQKAVIEFRNETGHYNPEIQKFATNHCQKASLALLYVQKGSAPLFRQPQCTLSTSWFGHLRLDYMSDPNPMLCSLV